MFDLISRIILTLIISSLCLTAYSQLQIRSEPSQTQTGELSDSEYRLIREIVADTSTTPLKDTIIIKYDFKYDNCWSLMERQSEKYIISIIKTYQLQILNVVRRRSNISVFRYRENGNFFSKVIEWDGTIRIDKKRMIKKILFRKPATCGSSVIIFPNKKYILVKADANFRTLYFSKSDMDEILNSR